MSTIQHHRCSNVDCKVHYTYRKLAIDRLHQCEICGYLLENCEHVLTDTLSPPAKLKLDSLDKLSRQILRDRAIIEENIAHVGSELTYLTNKINKLNDEIRRLYNDNEE